MALGDPGLEEADVFVFEQYAAKLNKWMPQAFLGKKKPKLGAVIKAVTKQFNGWGKPSSQFSVDELTDFYVKDRLSRYKGRADAVGRDAYVQSYGFDTLEGPISEVISTFVTEGW